MNKNAPSISEIQSQQTHFVLGTDDEGTERKAGLFIIESIVSIAIWLIFLATIRIARGSMLVVLGIDDEGVRREAVPAHEGIVSVARGLIPVGLWVFGSTQVLCIILVVGFVRNVSLVFTKLLVKLLVKLLAWRSARDVL